jgi:AraC family transcriptional regulator
VVDYPPDACMPTHEHETLGLSVVLRGHVEEVVGRTIVQTGTGGLVVKPAGTAHANRFGPTGARLLAIEIHPVAEDLLRGRAGLAPWRWLRSMAALRVAVGTLDDGVAPRGANGELADAVTLELIELLAQDDRLPVGGRPPRWLQVVRERLHEDHASPCRVRDLARDAGVHPVYLARRFRRQFGCSVTEYLRQVRVGAAAAALADDDRPVGEVAAATGFADQSHLCRVFRAAVGVAPRGYRALARVSGGRAAGRFHPFKRSPLAPGSLSLDLLGRSSCRQPPHL